MCVYSYIIYVYIYLKLAYLQYFAMYSAHSFAQIFQGEIRMYIKHGHNDYIP